MGYLVVVSTLRFAVGAVTTASATLPSTVTLVPASTATIVTGATTVSPTRTVVLNSSTSTTPVKGILKTATRNELVCTVPEHHGLVSPHQVNTSIVKACIDLYLCIIDFVHKTLNVLLNFLTNCNFIIHPLSGVR